MTDTMPVTTPSYRDEDLVYVDPESRTVVGLVQWSNSGRPKPLAMPPRAGDDERARPGRPRRTTYYPWGTYRSMKRLFKIEGKVHEQRGDATLDEVLPHALTEAYWTRVKHVPAEAGERTTSL